jgi:hypothetical protein
LTDADGRLVADYGGFQVLDVDEATAAGLAGQEGVEVRDDYDLIMLSTGPINTATPPAVALRARRGSFPGKRLHLIQFAAPVREAWLDSVKRQVSAHHVHPIPHLPRLAGVEHRPTQFAAQASPFVRGTEPTWTTTRPAEPRRREGRIVSGGAIQMVDDPGPNAATVAVIDSLKLAPILSESRSLGYLNVIVRLPAARLTDVARQPEVVSIQPYVVPRLFDERQGQILAGNISGTMPSAPGYLAWLASKGLAQEQFTTSGFAVDVTDDGLDDAGLPQAFRTLRAATSRTEPGRVCPARAAGGRGDQRLLRSREPQYPHHRRLQQPERVPAR